MRIFVRPSPTWSPEHVALLHTRLEFALGRFTPRIRSLSVHLRDLNGPRGGVDKQCLIAIRLERPRQVVVIEDVDQEAEAAISRAAERASRAVGRVVQAGRPGRDTTRGAR